MLRATSLKRSKPATVRVFSLILAIVAACFSVLLIMNAFRNGNDTDTGSLGWKMLVITSLAESAFDTIANYYNQADR